ncbi:hypothetical protein BGW80DRAFT_1280615 [Lactifluus volemus]|nr:hypothetical protein BGW80DRAFT_1280615 [Lactifluus volemus]
MASLLTVVPGSRRPIRVDSTGVVVNIAIQASDHPSLSSKIGTNTAVSRRKPQTTYRSPSLQFPNELCIERSGQNIRTTTSGLGPAPALSTRSTQAPPISGVPANVPTASIKPKYPMKPPLPIYHPLGRLALSLPELEFGAHGQNSSSPADDVARNATARARRPANRVRDAADPESIDANTPLSVPADAPPQVEKPSPRRRRNGGQTSSRRRRREADDGDATYPAKRTRANRAPVVLPSDVGSPDGSEEGTRAPERRSTRSRAAAQAKQLPVRRNSSASDRTQTSVSVSIAGSQPKKEDVDVTPPGAPVRSSAPSGQAEAGAHIAMPAQAKGSESQVASKMDPDEASRGTEALGLGTTPSREEGEPGEEGVPPTLHPFTMSNNVRLGNHGKGTCPSGAHR